MIKFQRTLLALNELCPNRGDATMKPAHSILNASFRYVPAISTSVAETWRRFGWRPATEDERKRRPAGIAAALVVLTLAAADKKEVTVALVEANAAGKQEYANALASHRGAEAEFAVGHHHAA